VFFIRANPTSALAMPSGTFCSRMTASTMLTTIALRSFLSMGGVLFLVASDRWEERSSPRRTSVASGPRRLNPRHPSVASGPRVLNPRCPAPRSDRVPPPAIILWQHICGSSIRMKIESFKAACHSTLWGSISVFAATNMDIVKWGGAFRPLPISILTTRIVF